ncbi:hypothetical protein VU00_11491, partial [Candidatus Electrothrix marina]
VDNGVAPSGDAVEQGGFPHIGSSYQGDQGIGVALHDQSALSEVKKGACLLLFRRMKSAENRTSARLLAGRCRKNTRSKGVWQAGFWGSVSRCRGLSSEKRQGSCKQGS